MSVDPINPQAVPPNAPKPQGAARPPARAVDRPDAPASAAPGAAHDAVELSETARALAGRVSGADPADGAGSAERLPSARLREILDRLASGFYDTPEVREAIARRLGPDLELPPSE
ncbi:MAG TPA: hypothetical protein VNK43_01730 [Gemmatimonadales bacterium]|nr:hypothetical protein [Gemmatimonadales bacterium]